ncbi:hypothetical protein NL50_09025 [Clostridium acetobutylicum]|nr:hypothetical protein NL50_09025 [Clostridium acetobutylicum]
MNKIEEAINRISVLECPTGDLENRVIDIFESFANIDRSKLKVTRANELDRDEAEAYKIEIQGERQPIIVLAKSGYDDYVAKVVDVCLKSKPMAPLY